MFKGASILNPKYPVPRSKTGWLDPSGNYYKVAPGQEHEEVAEIILGALTWQSKEYGDAGRKLLSQGWARVVSYDEGAAAECNKLTQEQRRWLEALALKFDCKVFLSNLNGSSMTTLFDFSRREAQFTLKFWLSPEGEWLTVSGEHAYTSYAQLNLSMEDTFDEGYVRVNEMDNRILWEATRPLTNIQKRELKDRSIERNKELVKDKFPLAKSQREAQSTFDSIRLGDQDLRVVHLTTPKEQSQGFQFHKEIPKDYGLYFPGAGDQYFHMQRVGAPLLLISLDDQNKVVGKEIRQPESLGKPVAKGQGKHILEIHPLYDPYVQVGSRLGDQPRIAIRKAQRKDYGWLSPSAQLLPVIHNHREFLRGNPRNETPPIANSYEDAWNKGYIRVTWVGNTLYANIEGQRGLSPKQKAELINIALETGKDKVVYDYGEDSKVIWQR